MQISAAAHGSDGAAGAQPPHARRDAVGVTVHTVPQYIGLNGMEIYGVVIPWHACARLVTEHEDLSAASAARQLELCDGPWHNWKVKLRVLTRPQARRAASAT
eukprot:CAMPEP_0119404474 /NCGR_PEP_ID=MMETSP1334-20130426/143913_1 /TAXON_ID=127549 /ORGANISM="Calcidiscus leptoporus, Strain RCC1130" /LENGTH=102 /DNA_ID=CAMNT_0007428441 /DNA_START=202 /DNA_END=510 /DNA_ORIENTATION=+